MAVSRTRQVARNASVSLVTQLFMIVLNFVSRTVFIRTLGVDYLGVNGLFTNVLHILSFAELGIGNAIVFSLYKPLAEHDEERLCSLMQLYKKFYLIIFGIVMVLGLAMIPFLDFLIKGEPNIKENLVFIYIFYLLDTALSYLYIYKQSIITADQKQYVVTTVLTTATILRVIGQIIVLYLTHNFILFLTINLVFRVAGNVYCSRVADKQYPFINNAPKPLSKEDSKKIFTDIKSMAAYKFGSIILNSSDSIIISAMVSITTVGLVSNYSMIIMACKNILNNITRSFTPSLGNLNAVGTEVQKYNVFNKVLLITAWLYGMAAIGIIVVSKYFVAVWVGTNYILSNAVVVAIVAEFYVAGIHTLESHYRYTMGFFVKGRIAPLMAAILNIGLSIWFCNMWGIVGVFVATSVSRVVTLGIIDSVIIFRDGFHKNPIIYFVKNAGFLALFIMIGLLLSWLVSLIDIPGWLGIIAKINVVLLVFNVVMVLVFHRTQGFKEIVTAVRKLFMRGKTNTKA